MDGATAPVSRAPSVPVRTLAIEVLEGPDAGLHAEAETETLTLGTAESNVVTLTDPTVSGFHLELSRCPDGVRVQDLGSTNGTMIGAMRVDQGVVPPETVVQIGRTQLKVVDGAGSTVAVHTSDELSELRGATPNMRRLMAQVMRVARTPVPVLLIGESGTGKELVARAIHEHSKRACKPIVTVDCGALSPTLVASELFGHERGAFTGADRQHSGAFERASGGTLFLDEIGELPAELQPQLLGVLERQRLRRLGGREDIAVDVRVVSATNRDLRSEVNSGAFRLDLYYRLAVVELRLPSLRERGDDIPLLVEHFLRECGHAGPVKDVVPSELMEALKLHRWPGNVRELRNWVEATMAMGESPPLVESLDGSAPTSQEVLRLPYKEARATVLGEFERSYLEHLLGKCSGNVSAAARHAKMDRSYLIKLIQRHGLK